MNSRRSPILTLTASEGSGWSSVGLIFIVLDRVKLHSLLHRNVMSNCHAARNRPDHEISGMQSTCGAKFLYGGDTMEVRPRSLVRGV